MKQTRTLRLHRLRRARRTRVKVRGIPARPRLSVFRSNRAMYAQLIDDVGGYTLASASSREVGAGGKFPGVALARKVGELLGKKALEQGVKEAVFDRGAYRYHGQVRAVAEGARAAGLKC